MNAFLYSSLEKAINAYLSLDPHHQEYLSPLSGRILRVNFETTPFFMVFMFTNQRIQILTNTKIEPDATITASPFTFLQWICTKDKNAVSGKVNLQGNDELIQNAYDFFQKIEIDWEEHLSKITGDVLAHKVGNLFRATKEKLNQCHSTFQSNLREYIQEEIKLFPTKEEVEDFMGDVEELRQSIDRMEARIHSLSSKGD